MVKLHGGLTEKSPFWPANQHVLLWPYFYRWEKGHVNLDNFWFNSTFPIVLIHEPPCQLWENYHFLIENQGKKVTKLMCMVPPVPVIFLWTSFVALRSCSGRACVPWLCRCHSAESVGEHLVCLYQHHFWPCHFIILRAQSNKAL